MPKVDQDGVEWLSEDDLAEMKACANEKTFDAFVESVGGKRIDALHPNLTFPNADYIFPDDKVIIELKTLETEVQNSDQFRAKVTVVNRKLFAKYKKTPLSLDSTVSLEYLKAFIELFRPPLARIIKKANSQIKNYQKQSGLLGLSGHPVDDQ